MLNIQNSKTNLLCGLAIISVAGCEPINHSNQVVENKKFIQKQPKDAIAWNPTFEEGPVYKENARAISFKDTEKGFEEIRVLDQKDIEGKIIITISGNYPYPPARHSKEGDTEIQKRTVKLELINDGYQPITGIEKELPNEAAILCKNPKLLCEDKDGYGNFWSIYRYDLKIKTYIVGFATNSNPCVLEIPKSKEDRLSDNTR